jgi:hypothetical protein
MMSVNRKTAVRRCCVISFVLLFLLNSSWLFAASYIVKDGKAESEIIKRSIGLNPKDVKNVTLGERSDTDGGKTPLKVLFIGNSQLRKFKVPIIIEGCDPAGAQEFGAFERIDQSTWLRPGGREKLVFVKKASSSRMCFGKQSNLKEERQDGSVYCNGCSVGNRPFRRGENR